MMSYISINIYPDKVRSIEKAEHHEDVVSFRKIGIIILWDPDCFVIVLRVNLIHIIIQPLNYILSLFLSTRNI